MHDPDYESFSRILASVINGEAGPNVLLEAVSFLFPSEAAFAVLYSPDASPVYLADTYPDEKSKAAVQLYVSKTYLLNPVHNAICAGLPSGCYRMADIAP
ncbi:MAG: LuxR family transcriptional regulator, partial [Pseudomonadota bacterium]